MGTQERNNRDTWNNFSRYPFLAADFTHFQLTLLSELSETDWRELAWVLQLLPRLQKAVIDWQANWHGNVARDDKDTSWKIKKKKGGQRKIRKTKIFAGNKDSLCCKVLKICFLIRCTSNTVRVSAVYPAPRCYSTNARTLTLLLDIKYVNQINKQIKTHVI